ncbi:MAG: hypothetical protein MK135_11395 [Polyangiaceae bacterium]|nr:hypothetical protein [Polyangiaceae bacterium]
MTLGTLVGVGSEVGGGSPALRFFVAPWLSVGGLGEALAFREVFIEIAFRGTPLTVTLSGIFLLFSSSVFALSSHQLRWMPRQQAWDFLFFGLLQAAILSSSLPQFLMGFSLAATVAWLKNAVRVGNFSEESSSARGAMQQWLGVGLGGVGCGLGAYYVGDLDWFTLQQTAAELVRPLKLWPLTTDMPLVQLLPISWREEVLEPLYASAASFIGFPLALSSLFLGHQFWTRPWTDCAPSKITAGSFLLSMQVPALGVSLLFLLSALFTASPLLMFLLAVAGFVSALSSTWLALVCSQLNSTLSYLYQAQLGLVVALFGLGGYDSAFALFCSLELGVLTLILGASLLTESTDMELQGVLQSSLQFVQQRFFLPRSPGAVPHQETDVEPSSLSDLWRHGLPPLILLVGWMGCMGLPLSLGFVGRAMAAGISFRPGVLGASEIVQPSTELVLTNFSLPQWFAWVFAFLFTLVVLLLSLGWMRALAGLSTSPETKAGNATLKNLKGDRRVLVGFSLFVAALSLLGGGLLADAFGLQGRSIPFYEYDWGAGRALQVAHEANLSFGVSGLWVVLVGVVAVFAGYFLFFLRQMLSYDDHPKQEETADEQQSTPSPQKDSSSALLNLRRLLWAELIDEPALFLGKAILWFEHRLLKPVLLWLPQFFVSVGGMVLRHVPLFYHRVALGLALGGVLLLGHFILGPALQFERVEKHDSGTYALSAAPALGFRYHFDTDADGKWDKELNQQNSVVFRLAEGESRVVRAEAVNILGQHVYREFKFARPLAGSFEGVRAVGVGSDGRFHLQAPAEASKEQKK